MPHKRRAKKRHKPSWRIHELLVKALNSAARKGKTISELPNDRKVKFLGKEYNKALYREDQTAERRTR